MLIGIVNGKALLDVMWYHCKGRRTSGVTGDVHVAELCLRTGRASFITLWITRCACRSPELGKDAAWLRGHWPAQKGWMRVLGSKQWRRSQCWCEGVFATKVSLGSGEWFVLVLLKSVDSVLLVKLCPLQTPQRWGNWEEKMETASQTLAEALYRGHIRTFILVLNIEENLDLHTYRPYFYSFSSLLVLFKS